MNHFLLTQVIILLIFAFCARDSGVVDNGGGTEITGYLVTSDAAPAESAYVWLINPVLEDTFMVRTDKSGKYVFTQKDIRPGKYTLHGRKDSLACIFINLSHESLYKGRVDTLRQTGWIYVSAFLEMSSLRQGIDVYIPGTSFIGKTDSSGSVILWHVPPNSYEVVIEHHGYFSCKDSAHVFAGMTDTVGPVTLVRDYSVPSEIPVPTGLRATIDTIWGTATLLWDTIDQNIQGYYVRIADTLVDHYPEDGRIRFTKKTTFTDTVFAQNMIDTISTKFRVYQICVVDINSNKGHWGERCSLLVRKPVVPPAPSCSLSNIPGSLIISVFTSVPSLWWIDSLVVNRSVLNNESMCIAKLPILDNQCLFDQINTIPAVTDSIIPVTYTIYTKSVYGFLSQTGCNATLAISNPYLTYNIEKPSAPQGLPPEVNDGEYVAVISPINSPLPNDTSEYRIVVTCNNDNSTFTTRWYTIPVIEVPLQTESRYLLQSQVRSKQLPKLQSPLSDICTVSVHKSHSIPKPSLPVGKSNVVHSTTGSYISYSNDTCSMGHSISMRYVVSYQGETASDSTGWLPVPDHAATIYWAKPGIAYLRAQSRCIVNPSIVSPWSNALVVTVE